MENRRTSRHVQRQKVRIKSYTCCGSLPVGQTEGADCEYCYGSSELLSKSAIAKKENEKKQKGFGDSHLRYTSVFLVLVKYPSPDTSASPRVARCPKAG